MNRQQLLHVTYKHDCAASKRAVHVLDIAQQAINCVNSPAATQKSLSLESESWLRVQRVFITGVPWKSRPI
jgi:hypothetical protein